MRAAKIIVFAVFGLWVVVMAFALYGFGTHGVISGLDPGSYRGRWIDYAIQLAVVCGPPIAVAIVGAIEIYRRR